MVMVRLQGGLGNQLFQYAAGRRLAEVHGTELRLDLTFFGEQAKRGYSLGPLRLAGRPGSLRELGIWQPRGRSHVVRNWARRHLLHRPRPTVVREPHFHFAPHVLSAPDETYLDGYWQSEKYFADIAPKLRDEIAPRGALSLGTQRLCAEVNERESVSIHIRRGDYLSDPAAVTVHGVCSLAYYQRAVERMAQHVTAPHFYVFSDDPAWAKANLILPHPLTVVSPEQGSNELDDLFLMARCRHHIVANSTFSWWGAWLNPLPDKRVIAPSPWFRSTELDARDLIPPSWEMVAA